MKIKNLQTEEIANIGWGQFRVAKWGQTAVANSSMNSVVILVNAARIKGMRSAQSGSFFIGVASSTLSISNERDTHTANNTASADILRGSFSADCEAWEIGGPEVPAPRGHRFGMAPCPADHFRFASPPVAAVATVCGRQPRAPSLR